jgi:hypothetical protein
MRWRRNKRQQPFRKGSRIEIGALILGKWLNQPEIVGGLRHNVSKRGINIVLKTNSFKPYICMKTKTQISMKTHFCALLVVLLLTLSCSRDDVAPSADSQPEFAADAGGNLTALINRNKQEIEANLNLIAKGLVGRMNDANFTELVRNRALQQNVDNDYNVLVSDLIQTCQGMGVSLPGQLCASLSLQGGTAVEMQKLNQIAGGFTIEGTTFKPVIFMPQLDVVEFPNVSWSGSAPQFVSTVFSKQGNQLSVINPAGATSLRTESQLRTVGNWFVGFQRVGDVANGGDIYTLWAKCRCVQGNPSGGNVPVTCTSNPGSATTLPDCGRTGLFNNSCSKSCTGTPNH